MKRLFVKYIWLDTLAFSYVLELYCPLYKKIVAGIYQ